MSIKMGLGVEYPDFLTWLTNQSGIRVVRELGEPWSYMIPRGNSPLLDVGLYFTIIQEDMLIEITVFTPKSNYYTDFWQDTHDRFVAWLNAAWPSVVSKPIITLNCQYYPVPALLKDNNSKATSK